MVIKRRGQQVLTRAAEGVLTNELSRLVFQDCPGVDRAEIKPGF